MNVLNTKSGLEETPVILKPKKDSVKTDNEKRLCRQNNPLSYVETVIDSNIVTTCFVSVQLQNKNNFIMRSKRCQHCVECPSLQNDCSIFYVT